MSYQSKLQRATTMSIADPENAEYWRGYARGLRKNHHGDNFGTDAEHNLWMTASGDQTRENRSRGYRDGFNDVYPKPVT